AKFSKTRLVAGNILEIDIAGNFRTAVRRVTFDVILRSANAILRHSDCDVGVCRDYCAMCSTIDGNSRALVYHNEIWKESERRI
ncbi:hypothetical protein PMAYCL1PPCAC_21772, partial [Pristionchus mayeri]